MDLTQFYRDDRPGEYEVTVEVSATVTETVKANSPDEARREVEERLEADDIEVFGSDIDQSRIASIRKTQTIYCIRRPGTTITGTSHPQPGDEPREPFEYERDAYRP